jgi:hypothetical protein
MRWLGEIKGKKEVGLGPYILERDKKIPLSSILSFSVLISQKHLKQKFTTLNSIQHGGR